jgi:hypothetical protein
VLIPPLLRVLLVSKDLRDITLGLSSVLYRVSEQVRGVAGIQTYINTSYISISTISYRYVHRACSRRCVGRGGRGLEPI